MTTAFCNLIRWSEATGWLSWCSFAQGCPRSMVCPTVTSNSIPTAGRISSEARARAAPRAPHTVPQTRASMSSIRPLQPVEFVQKGYRLSHDITERIGRQLLEIGLHFSIPEVEARIGVTCFAFANTCRPEQRSAANWLSTPWYTSIFSKIPRALPFCSVSSIRRCPFKISVWFAEFNKSPPIAHTNETMYSMAMIVRF